MPRIKFACSPKSAVGLCGFDLARKAGLTGVLKRGLRTLSTSPSGPSTALQSIDLLQSYGGLVELGRITSDDNQIRVVMQLRRLHKALKDYVSPALTSHYSSSAKNVSTFDHPWWSRQAEDEVDAKMIRKRSSGTFISNIIGVQPGTPSSMECQRGTMRRVSRTRRLYHNSVYLFHSNYPRYCNRSKNQAPRFISLIDALYEAKCGPVCIAEVEPEHLFFPDAAEDHSKADVVDDIDVILAEAVGETRDLYRPNVSHYDAPRMSEAPSTAAETPFDSPTALETLSIFSGKDEQFAFKRALSRLIEMTSESYGTYKQWTPLPDAARKWERTSITSNVSTGQRPEAPRLREEHIWGVREDWGRRSGTWGRGTAMRTERHDSGSDSNR
ncbi:hypothetical protein BC835DRAFT_1310420 [Cytidiella melzeri]|nr:hypothetical protein BC835DRAFT_1310420 [Cytidiella melzeri]